jgi:hypothetical protein
VTVPLTLSVSVPPRVEVPLRTLPAGRDHQHRLRGSTINQVVSRRFVKKQQMQWTPRGAHLLLQAHIKVLNGELEAVFQGWYPRFHAKAA